MYNAGLTAVRVASVTASCRTKVSSGRRRHRPRIRSKADHAFFQWTRRSISTVERIALILNADACLNVVTRWCRGPTVVQLFQVLGGSWVLRRKRKAVASLTLCAGGHE